MAFQEFTLERGNTYVLGFYSTSAAYWNDSGTIWAPPVDWEWMLFVNEESFITSDDRMGWDVVLVNEPPPRAMAGTAPPTTEAEWHDLGSAVGAYVQANNFFKVKIPTSTDAAPDGIYYYTWYVKKYWPVDASYPYYPRKLDLYMTGWFHIGVPVDGVPEKPPPCVGLVCPAGG